MKKYYIHFCLILIGSILYFLANVQRTAIPGAIFNQLQLSLNLSAPYITALGAVFMYTYALNQLVIGYLIDKFGSLKVISIGAIIFSLGALLFPLSNSIIVLYLSRVLVGFGASTFYLSMLKEVKLFFSDKNFSIALSILLFIGYSGGIIANAPLVLCTNQIGWKETFLILGIFSILITLLFIIATINLGRHTSVKNRNFSLKPFKEVLSKPLNRNIFIYGGINYGLCYVIQTVIGKKFLEDFCNMSESNSAIALSTMAVVASFAGMILATLCRICKNNRIIFLKIISFCYLIVFSTITLCIIFNIKTEHLAFLYLILALGSNISPLLVPIIHNNNSYRLAGTAISIMVCGFSLLVGVFGNTVGFLMNIFKPENIQNVLVYGKNSYLLAFLFFTFLSIFEVMTAFKLKK